MCMKFVKRMKNNNLKIFVLFLVLNCVCIVLSAVEFPRSENRNYTLVERTDLRRYYNGKYTGLMSREVKSFIVPVKTEDGFVYDGSFYVNQDTRRGVSYLKGGIHEAIGSEFAISNDGYFRMINDNGYPSFRSFPSFPQKEINPGDSWESEAQRAVDPLDKGIFTRMPMYVQYTYLRDEVYNNQEVYLLSAKWATRYGTGTKYVDIYGDETLVAATGNHSATIYVSKNTGNALVVRDSVEETFAYSDGNKITFKGTIALFTEYPPTLNEEEIFAAVAKTDKEKSEESKVVSGFVEPEDFDDFEVQKTNAGIMFSLSNLKFKPDSSVLLDGESQKLIKIAEVLKKLQGSQFLVEGHTASTGNEKGEMSLSLERARSVIAALVKLGVPEQSFICKGSGGTRPVADNSTPEGKAKNRRVEITILE